MFFDDSEVIRTQNELKDLCGTVADGGGGHKQSFVYGNYIDEVVHRWFQVQPSFRYYVHDHLYSPVAFVNSSANVIDRYEYDAYGSCSIYDNSYQPRSQPSDGNPYLFTGRRVDFLDDGNLVLQYNRNRYYDYYMGRWFTHDPLGYVEAINLYQYVGNNPITLNDPYGLLPAKKVAKLFLALPKMVAMITLCKKDRSWEIHPKIRIGLFVTTVDAKCDCKYGYSWVKLPQDKCFTKWDKGKWALSRDPKSVIEAIKKLRVEYTITYGNSVATAAVSGEVKGYLKALLKGGVKYRIGYSVDAQALKWVKPCYCGCGKCAKGFVSCKCKAGLKQNVLGGLAVTGAVVTAYYAIPALGPYLGAAAKAAWEAAKTVPDPLGAGGG